MGLIYADIELINGDDLALARKFIIGEDEIKRTTINILVDTGTYYLCINESIQAILQLPFIEKRKAQLANGHIEEYDIVGPIELKFKNRRCHVDAMVLKGDNEPLLGAIPMEDILAPTQKIKTKKMSGDVLIHPLSQELIVNPEHPLMVQMKLK
jgi:hypothetical protein